MRFRNADSLRCPYLSCKVAILLALSIAYHGLPPRSTVIPTGPLPLTLRPSEITPSGVSRATLPALNCVNHTLPSAVATMSSGPVLGVRVGNCVT